MTLNKGAIYLELFVQLLNVIFDPLDELCLVLPNGAPDVGTHKQSVEAGENPEHLVSILGSAQLISETRCNASLKTTKARDMRE